MGLGTQNTSGAIMYENNRLLSKYLTSRWSSGGGKGSLEMYVKLPLFAEFTRPVTQVSFNYMFCKHVYKLYLQGSRNNCWKTYQK